MFYKNRYLIAAGALIALSIAMVLAIVLLNTLHFHEFTEAHYTETEQFLVCPDDNAMDPESRAGHSKAYEFTPDGHRMVCTHKFGNGVECDWQEATLTPHDYGADGKCTKCGYSPQQP